MNKKKETIGKCLPFPVNFVRISHIFVVEQKIYHWCLMIIVVDTFGNDNKLLTI